MMLEVRRGTEIRRVGLEDHLLLRNALGMLGSSGFRRSCIEPPHVARGSRFHGTVSQLRSWFAQAPALSGGLEAMAHASPRTGSEERLDAEQSVATSPEQAGLCHSPVAKRLR